MYFKCFLYLVTCLKFYAKLLSENNFISYNILLLLMMKTNFKVRILCCERYIINLNDNLATIGFAS